MKKSVSLTKLFSFLKELKESGVSTSEICSLLEVPHATFENPDYQVSSEMITKLCCYACEHVNIDMGLVAGIKSNRGFSSVLGMLLLSSKTAQEALDHFCTYELIVDSTVSTSYSVAGNFVTIRFKSNLFSADLPTMYQEYKIAGFIAYLRYLLDDATLSPSKVSFVHAPQFSRDNYEAILGCSPSFNASSLSISYPISVTETLFSEHNQELKGYLEEETKKKFTQITAEELVSTKVIREIENSPKGVFPTITKISEQLALSERTLQNYLKSEKTTFSAIVNEYHKKCAINLLQSSSNSIDGIAYLLGFSERSTFHKAFKRWTNMTPAEYRKLN
jgi:AraC-like DNA-binding protein